MADLIIITTLFVVAFVIRYFGIHTVCMAPDEWLYWSKTNMILVNNWIPVLEVFECSPPTYSHVCAFFASFFGSDLYVFRTVSTLFGALTIPVMYLLGKEMYNRRIGFVAAVLLCFAPYHCFYSRIYKLEAFTIFLLVTFLYFFWLSEIKEKKLYQILTGIFLGLSIAAKYLPVFILVALPVYMFWIYGRSKIRKIIKKIVIIYIFAFLSILPLVFGLFYSGAGLQPLYFYTQGIYEKGVAKRPIQYYTVGVLIEEGMTKMCDVLAYGSVFFGNELEYILKTTTIYIFFVTIFTSIYNALKKDKRCSFIVILLIFLVLTILFMHIAKYYLIYTLPFYFILTSRTFFDFFENVNKIGDILSKFVRYLFTLLFIVNVTLIIPLAVFSVYWDKGDNSWVCDSVNYIKEDSVFIDHRPIVIGTFIFINEPIEFHMYLNNINASIYNLVIPSKYPEKSEIAILDRINDIKPDYILMIKSSIFFYGTYFQGKLKEKILKDYFPIFTTNSYPYNALILKRKEIVSHNYTKPHSRYIDYKFFEAETPLTLKKLKPYTIEVKIKNIDDKGKQFILRLYSNKFLIYVYHKFQNVSLDGGEEKIVKYKILPLKNYENRKIPLTIEIYTKTNNGDKVLIDTYTKYIKIY